MAGPDPRWATTPREGCDPVADAPETLACAADIHGGAMRWRGPDGQVHRVAATTPSRDAPCEDDAPHLLFTACGCWDVPEDATLISADGGAALTCPTCAAIAGH